MKKKTLFVIIPFVLIGLVYYIFGGKSSEGDSDIVTEVKKGSFKIEITTTGELEARNSIKVLGPSGLRNTRVWNLTIENIVPEGTIVQKGDYIASLDKSELSDRLNDNIVDLDQRLSDFTQAKLDSAIKLRNLRDALINKDFAVEEAKLVLEQSQYEPPATIKQNKFNLERAEREFIQAKENYELEKEKAVEQVKKSYTRYLEREKEMKFLEELIRQMEVMAPEAGMVTYIRDHRGNRLGQGSVISAWDPAVATLPDLSVMNSKTYVNEVDIRQIQEGQSVLIGLDAFPEKSFTGRVINVANIGEQIPNSDAKVFEVLIQISEKDTTLRPAMTTSNTIIASVIENAISVPLEALHSQGDSLVYVFKKSPLSVFKQEVRVGSSNANEAVITDGLSENDKVLLSMPLKPETKKMVFLDEPEQISSID